MIYIAMGANLPSRFGVPEATLEEAKRILQSYNVEIVHFSRTWVSAPVPMSDQPFYRNAVLQVKTDLGPEDLLRLLLSVEDHFGRERAEKNGPRVLDLDLLAYGDEVRNTMDMVLPHPRMHERGFVLIPMQEIAPGWVHPVLKRSVSELVSALDLSDSMAAIQDKAA